MLLFFNLNGVDVKYVEQLFKRLSECVECSGDDDVVVARRKVQCAGLGEATEKSFCFFFYHTTSWADAAKVVYAQCKTMHWKEQKRKWDFLFFSSFSSALLLLSVFVNLLFFNKCIRSSGKFIITLNLLFTNTVNRITHSDLSSNLTSAFEVKCFYFSR